MTVTYKNICDFINYTASRRKCLFCNNKYGNRIPGCNNHQNVEIVCGGARLWFQVRVKENSMYYYDIYSNKNKSTLFLNTQVLVEFEPALILTPEQFASKLPFFLNYQ